MASASKRRWRQSQARKACGGGVRRESPVTGGLRRQGRRAPPCLAWRLRGIGGGRALGVKQLRTSRTVAPEAPQQLRNSTAMLAHRCW